MKVYQVIIELFIIDRYYIVIIEVVCFHCKKKSFYSTLECVHAVTLSYRLSREGVGIHGGLENWCRFNNDGLK